MRKRIFTLGIIVSVLTLVSCGSPSLKDADESVLQTTGHNVYLKDDGGGKVSLESKVSPSNSKAVIISLKSNDPSADIDKVYANGVELKGNEEGQYQFEMPDSDVEVTYTTKVASYKVRFLDYDNYVLQEKELDYGTVPSFDGIEPYRESTSLGNYTFLGWDKELTSVIGDIDYHAVYEVESTKDFVFTLDSQSGSYSLTYYGGDAIDVVVPQSYLGLPVVSIGSYAFYNAKNMETVTVPESIATVADNAFSLSRSLKTVKGMTGVTSIGKEAFSETPNLEQVEFVLEILASIGEGAFLNSGILSIVLPDHIPQVEQLFNGAKRLKEVHLPDSWDTIPAQTFYNASSLTTWNWPTGLKVIDSYAFTGTSSITEVKNLPSTLTEVGMHAFDGSTSLKEVVLPEGVLTIRQYAFQDNTNLTSISLPSSVNKTQWGVFKGASALTSITIPEHMLDDQQGELGDDFFAGATSLKSVTLPSTLKSFGVRAFANCISLGSITLPAGITTLKEGLFFNNTSLANLVIPDSVTSIEAGSLTNVKGYSLNTKKIQLEGDLLVEIGIGTSKLISVDKAKTFDFVVPEGITTIGGYAFYGKVFNSLKLPSTLESFEASTFSGMRGIKELSIPSTVTAFYTAFNNKEMAYESDLYAPNELEKIVSDAEVSFYPAQSFNGLPNLKELRITNQATTSLWGDTFANNPKLTDVYLPKSLTQINAASFPKDRPINVFFEGSREEWNKIKPANTNLTVRFNVDIKA